MAALKCIHCLENYILAAYLFLFYHGQHWIQFNRLFTEGCQYCQIDWSLDQISSDACFTNRCTSSYYKSIRKKDWIIDRKRGNQLPTFTQRLEAGIQAQCIWIEKLNKSVLALNYHQINRIRPRLKWIVRMLVNRLSRNICIR